MIKLFISLTIIAVIGIIVMTNDNISQEIKSTIWAILVGLLYIIALLFLKV